MTDQPYSTMRLAEIRALIRRTDGNADRFVEILRREGWPHISFSQVTTVEACQYHYFLEYVQSVQLEPIPDYFTKGRLLHNLIANYYEIIAYNQPVSIEQLTAANNYRYTGENSRHLHNAFAIHLENQWRGYRVLGIEQSFALLIHPEIPPCVGVIDLILEKDGRIVLVDHKTGRDFYPLDELQLAIYRQHISEQYGALPCDFYYDQYRWVNNLNRIRKPAFQRTHVSLSPSLWERSFNRIVADVRLIERIKTTQMASRKGECFRCPYRWQCR